jgi:Domain of unknown function (DUF5122) beta-propeller
VQTDRKIVVGGYVGRVSPGTSFDFALVRYNLDGSPDAGFDGDGRVVTDIDGGSDLLTAVAPQRDGSAVHRRVVLRRAEAQGLDASKRAYSRTVKKGRVIAQTQRAVRHRDRS